MHTRGPWTHTGSGDIEDKHGRAIGTTSGLDYYDIANAHLMAAAPALLEANEAMEEYERLMDAGEHVAAMEAYARAVELRKAAIKQAKGEL